jgi:AraC-like DNA-binding protein
MVMLHGKRDKLVDDLLPFDIQSQIGSTRVFFKWWGFIDRNNAVYFEHAHKGSLELHYLIQGRQILLVENKRFQLHEGMVYYIAPNVVHKGFWDLPGNDEFLKFTIGISLERIHAPDLKTVPRAEEEMTALERCFTHRKFWVGKDSEGCINLIRNIQEERSHARVGYYSVIQNMLTNLIILSARCMSQQTVADYEVPKNINPYYGARIADFIRRNYRDNITRENAVHFLHLSAGHIDHIMREKYGMTFKQSLRQTRLEIAKKKLSETNLSLERIAEDVGIDSASSLSRLFKAKEGITPSAFRRQRFPNGIQARPE